MDFGKLIMDNIGMLSSFVLGIGVVAGVWATAKAVLAKVYALIGVVVGAMEDNRLTAPEVESILTAGGDVAGALKNAIASSKK